MAHGFLNFGKNTSFVSKKEPAWHNLGKVVETMTSKEALELAKLNFKTEIVKIQTVYDDPLKNKVFENRYAVCRTDNNYPLGVVKERYNPIQNEEIFSLFDKIAGKDNIYYETAGCLGNGEVVFVSLKLPSFLVANKDLIDKYLIATTTHDGSGSLNIFYSPVRVVCNNTLQMAFKNCLNKIAIKHTLNYKEKLNIVDKSLNLVQQNEELSKECFDMLYKKQIKDDVAISLIENVFNLKDTNNEISTRSSNALDEILQYYEIGYGQADIKGTAYGVLNGVTGYLSNVKNYKNDESKFKNLFYQKDSKIIQKTLDLLVAV